MPQPTSKARLVITALFVDHQSPAEVAARYGVHRDWVYKLKARYEAEGETALEPRSRRPKTSPSALPPEVVDLIVAVRKELADAGLDAGPETIAWHLAHHHGHHVARSTISRHLTAAGLVTPEPKKRPKSSSTRFEASMPNETWQSDFTHYRLSNGIDVEIISWLDDCTRYALHVTAHARVTTPIVLSTFREALARHGIPASTLTDNAMVYTVRLSGGRGGRNAFEQDLHDRHVVQKNSRPGHPTTCGKAERFQQTMKKWLRAQPIQPSTIAELQALLDRFADEYNHRRPHRSLPHRATPRPTTESGTTPSTKPARSPSDTAAVCTTSASGEPTPEPASSCSSKTSTSGSSTPPPANSSANWSSTPTATTSPERPKAPPADPGHDNTRTCNRRSGCRRCLETSH